MLINLRIKGLTMRKILCFIFPNEKLKCSKDCNSKLKHNELHS